MAEEKQNRNRKRKRTFGSNKSERGNALSIKSFIKAKQHDSAFHRNKKKKEFIKNAKIVNSYKRLLKREGREFKQDKGKGDSKKESEKKKGRKKGNKTDRFVNERKKANKLKEEEKQKEIDAAERQKQKELNQKRRKQRTRNLSKRTRKGQPILKHTIGRLLEQIGNGSS